MNETDYRNIEPWMHSVMEKYWTGQTWNQAVGNNTPMEKLSNPQMHGLYSIGKIFIPEKCSICQGVLTGYFASRRRINEGLKWNRSAACIACGHKPFAIHCNCSPCSALLFSLRQKEGDNYLLVISEDQADELRDLFGEQLQIVGFDENYQLTTEGEILESLIDKFFIG